MQHDKSGLLSEVRAKMYVYTAATGNARIKKDTMDRLFDEVIDAMEVVVHEHYGNEV